MTVSDHLRVLVARLRHRRMCTHLDQVRDVRPRTEGCEECLASGMRWVHLRLCLTCGHVGCCLASEGKHSLAHFDRTGHAIIRSLEPGEDWRYCWEDWLQLDP
jgi:uncharacterized UBP type Zn finger protein